MTVPVRRALFVGTLFALLGVALASIGPAQALAPTPRFAPYINYDVGKAKSVALGDFTGDGRNDVAISTQDSDTAAEPNHVYLFAQGPDGWMHRVDELETQMSVAPDLGLAAGDLDGDGKTDAVLANGQALDVFFQRAGGLAGGQPISLDGAQTVEAADLDGDGKVDLVASATAGLVVLKGLGAGSFGAPVVVSAQRQKEVEVGDVTSDGRQDLVSCNGTVALVFAQLAGGTFAPPTQHAGDIACESVALGDVNGDGRADVAMVGGANAGSSRLDVFVQQSNGTVAQTAVTYPTSDFPRSVEGGDMNGDGRADLVVVHDGWRRVGVHAQAPDRTLDPERLNDVPFSGLGPAHKLAIGDVNSDGRPDAVVANDRHGLVILWGQPAGPSTTTSSVKLATTVVPTPAPGSPRPLFTAPQGYEMNAYPESVAAGDFNGDGRTDVAMTSTSGRDPVNENKLFVFYQGAGGGLDRAVRYDTEGARGYGDNMALAAGDIDGDGASDLILSTHLGVNVFLQRDGRLADRTLIELRPADRIDLADMDGDGKADLVMSGEEIRLYRSLGDGKFAPVVHVLAEGWRDDLAIGDINGDGRPDLVTMAPAEPPAVEVYHQRVGGGFGAAERVPLEGRPSGIALGDLNSDGKLDLAVNVMEGVDHHYVTRIYLQSAGGTLSAGPVLAAGRDGPLKTGDVDGDGRTDLVGIDYDLRVRLQQAGGQFGAEQYYPLTSAGSVGRPSNGSVLADISGDRRLDVAAVNDNIGLDVVRNMSTAVPPQATTAVGATIHPLTPQRILDTRTGLGAPAARLGAGGTIGLQVTGAGGVPASGVTAVVLNVTVTEPSAGSFLTVSPTGETRPLASNLNYVAGQTVPNLVVAKLGAGGKVDLFNSSGTTHVIADVAGWYGPDTGPPGGRYTPVTPARILDTRSTSKLGPAGIVGLQVTGQGGVPASGVSAVVLNVTATEPTATSFLTAWPAGEARPMASNLNYGPGQAVPNLVVVKVGAGGRVDLYNHAGSTHVVVDVAGWYGTEAVGAGGTFTPVAPARLLDSRTGVKVGPGATLALQVTGRGGVPASGVSAVVLNVTATEPTALSFLTAWPAGEARPLASNLNYGPGQTVPNLVVVKVGAGGVVSLYNSSGSTHVVADVAGWYA